MNKLFITLAATLVLPLAASAAPVSPDTREIAPGVFLLPGQLQPNFSPDGNSVIVRGGDALLAVDSGRGSQHTRKLIDLLRQMNLPVQALVNTHWHLDHIGGNAVFKKELPDTRIYAPSSLEAALDGFHAESRAQLESLVPTLPPGSSEAQRYATELELLSNSDELTGTEKVSSNGRITLGDRVLELRVSKQAVAEEDLWLFDSETRTLIAGDLVTLPVPLFDTACPERWQAAQRDLASQDFKLLVPGHGQPLTPVTFKRYRKAYDALLLCAGGKKRKDEASCTDGWFKDLGPLVNPNEVDYGRKLLDYYLETNLRPDAPGRKRWCP